MNNQRALDQFRNIPEKHNGAWQYRAFGQGARPLLLLPGGELVDDLGFEFALSMQDDHRIIYPAYPLTGSIEELADGLIAILDAEGIAQVAILGASFGGAVAQVLVRRHPDRVRELILSNTGVPLRRLAGPVRLVYWIAKASSWKFLSRLLCRAMLNAVCQSDLDREFWKAYLTELFSKRITKVDVLCNLRIQSTYHSKIQFSPDDLKDWSGRVLILESDTDIIGPHRRESLRETYPKASVHTFHNAGHAPMFTRFHDYLEVVKAFLDSGTSASPLNEAPVSTHPGRNAR